MKNNKINRVLLIVPPFTLPRGKFKVSVPPLGSAYIAAVLENENYSVKIPGYSGHVPASVLNDRGNLRECCLSTVGEKFH